MGVHSPIHIQALQTIANLDIIVLHVTSAQIIDVTVYIQSIVSCLYVGSLIYGFPATVDVHILSDDCNDQQWYDTYFHDNMTCLLANDT